MTNKRILRCGLYFLAGVLAGAPAMLASTAANAHVRRHHGVHTIHFAPPNATVPVLNRDAASGTRQPQDRKAVKTDGAPPNTPIGSEPGRGGKPPIGGSKDTWTSAPAKDASAPDFHTKDLGPIDTRITVQPRVSSERFGRARQVKSRIGPIGSRYSQRRAFTGRKTGHVTRNAIGLPITQPGTGPAPNNGLVRSPVVAPGLAPIGSDRVVKLSPGPDRFGLSHPNPVVNGSDLGRPRINGNGFVRRGFVPATLGGPTKNVLVGIDGSTIRPKH
jgi:hypothetical protein